MLAELIANVSDGNVRPAPARTAVPRWVRRALMRGLSVDPERRHRSMDALLAELVRNPWRRWQQAGLVAIPTVLVGVGVTAYEREVPRVASYCQDVAEKLDGTWDDARRSAIAGRFETSELPYAADVQRAVEQRLDTYAQAWVNLQTQACRDEVEGARPQAVLALQMTCLERRRQSLGALTELLAESDATTLERSVDAADALPGLEICADLEVLMARESTQDDVDPAAVREIDEALAKVKVLRDAARFNEARALAEPLVARAVEAGYTRGEAFAREQLATALDLGGNTAAAERAYHDALSSALASGSAEIVVRASLGLIWITADPSRPLIEADRWYAHGKGALARMGGDPELAAELERSLGQAYLQHGDPRRAEPHVRESLRIREEAFGPDDESISVAASTMGQLLSMQGKLAESRASFERALAVTEARTGPAHPDMAASLTNLGSAWAESGDIAKAIGYFERALAIDIAALGPDHVRNAISHHNLASALGDAGRLDEARIHARRELEIVERAHGPEHVDVASAIANLADFDAEEGNQQAALDGFLRAYEIARKSTGAEGLQAARYHSNAARSMLALGRAAESVEIFRAVIEIRRAALGDDHPSVGDSRVDLAQGLIALGRHAEALTEAERGLQLVVDAGGPPGRVAEAHFAFAVACWEVAGCDRARAIAEATKAAALTRTIPSMAPAIDAWLVAHR